jgi:hypothetical protein
MHNVFAHNDASTPGGVGILQPAAQPPPKLLGSSPQVSPDQFLFTLFGSNGLNLGAFAYVYAIGSTRFIQIDSIYPASTQFEYWYINSGNASNVGIAGSIVIADKGALTQGGVYTSPYSPEQSFHVYEIPGWTPFGGTTGVSDPQGSNGGYVFAYTDSYNQVYLLRLIFNSNTDWTLKNITWYQLIRASSASNIRPPSTGWTFTAASNAAVVPTGLNNGFYIDQVVS